MVQTFTSNKKYARILTLGMLIFFGMVLIYSCEEAPNLNKDTGDDDLDMNDDLDMITSIELDGSTLQWDTIENATSYQLYRSDTLAGAYLPYKDGETITDSQYDLTEERFSSQKSYYYKIKACLNETCTELSDIHALVEPITTSEVRLEDSNLRWNAVEGATSYQIYRSETLAGTYLPYKDDETITDSQYDLTEERFSSQKSYYYKVKACIDDICTELSDSSALIEPVVITSMALNDYVLTWNTIDGMSYQVQKKKGTSGSYEDLEGVPSIQAGKASLTVDDAYAFYRIMACAPQADQASDPSCTVYGAEIENTGSLSTICTAKRHEPSTKAELEALITAEITKQGQTANLACIDTSAITDMAGLFKDKSTFNGDMSKWDVSSVTTMRSMFSGASAFNQNIGGWTMSKVTDMSYMFYSASAFNQDISKWDVSNVTTIAAMFYSASVFNQNIGDWTVSKVTNMRSMFFEARAFNQDISKWDVSNVTLTDYMFCKASMFNQDIGDWDVGKVTDMDFMFYEASAFNQNLEKWADKVAQVTNMGNVFTRTGLASPPTWYSP